MGTNINRSLCLFNHSFERIILIPFQMVNSILDIFIHVLFFLGRGKLIYVNNENVILNTGVSNDTLSKLSGLGAHLL